MAPDENLGLTISVQDPAILQRLLHFTTADAEELGAKQYKYPYVSCEVLSSDVWSICEGIVDSENLLSDYWKFLDRPAPLDALKASYFTKVNNTFFTKKTTEVR